MISVQSEPALFEDDAVTVPQGFKRTDIGVMPKDWGFDQLGNLTKRVGSGITPTGGEKVYTKEGLPFIRSQNVGWGDLQLSDLAFIPDEIHKTFATSEIEEGDVLLNITGASIGRSAVADARIVGGNVNQHVCEIRTERQKLEPKYLNYYLLSAPGQRQIDNFQAGGNRQGLNYNQIRSFTIPLPSLPEQRAIAAALSDVDGLIGALDALIEKKRAIKQAAMQQLLTGKKRLPGFSEDWKTKHLGELTTSRSGGTPLTSMSHFYNGGIPWVSITDMTGVRKWISTTERTLSQEGLNRIGNQLWPPKTVLYAMYASIGECSIASVELSSSQAILGIQTKSSLDSEYLYYHLVLRKDDVLKIAQHGTQANLNAEIVRNFQIPLPAIQEQRAIAAVLSDMDAGIAALERRLEKTKQIKQGMMQQLLTGRIRLPSVGRVSA